jgi:Protein of unknown function (DUF3352)
MARRARGLLAAVLCLLALAAVGCGGDGGSTTLSGAEIVPADVPLYVSFDTDLESEQWQAAQDLLDRFPGKERLLNEIERELASEDVDFERDVRPVLGPEVGVAWLDLDDDNTFVGLTQPQDEAKFNALLEKGDERLVHTEIEGWTVFAESQAVLDRFRREREGEKLSGSSAYEEAVGELPDDALVKLYVGGPGVQEEIRQGIAEEGAPQGFAQRFEAFESFAAALTAEGDGVRLEGGAIVDSEVEFDTYEAQLPNALPAGALLYISFANLDEPTRSVIEGLKEAVPNFEEQLRQAEQGFGFSLENDVYPILESEGAFAIYPAEPVPAFVLALADDERAVRVMDRLGALMELGEEGSLRQHQVEGVSVREIAFPDEGFSIFYAAIDGVFVASNRRDSVVAADDARDRLSDDPLYQEAQEGLAAEGGTIAFVYGNLEAGLPEVLEFAEEEGETVTQEVRENTEPLRSFFVTVTQDGNRFELSGFLGIE